MERLRSRARHDEAALYHAKLEVKRDAERNAFQLNITIDDIITGLQREEIENLRNSE
jgi:hypothetical protein